MKSLISIFLLAATVAFADTPEQIQRVTLDERVVITVPVATSHVAPWSKRRVFVEAEFIATWNRAES